jgi:prepilin-type N-terminal cleavage/methylation domain-containing protein
LVSANNQRRASGGFTLLELALVVMLIGVLLSVTVPHLLPVIAYSELEGAARHLANYGRSVMARAALSHENLTVHVKLDERMDEPQQYWCVEWPDQAAEFGLSDDGEDKEKKKEALKIVEEIMQNPSDLMLQAEATKKLEQMGQNQAELLALAVQEKFERMARMGVMARARNVKHDGIMDEFGPLFEKEFTLDPEEDGKDKANEVMDDVLARTRVTKGVEIESLEVGETRHSSGEVEIEATPLGLSSPVRFYLTNEDRDYLTVVWDPITGNAYVLDGKEQGE